MTICGIETLMHLGSLGKAISNLQSPQPLGSNLSKQMGLLKTHQECLLFSWEILLKKTKCYL